MFARFFVVRAGTIFSPDNIYIGVYDAKSFAFKSILKLPEILLDSMDVCVDEPAAKRIFRVCRLRAENNIRFADLKIRAPVASLLFEFRFYFSQEIHYECR